MEGLRGVLEVSWRRLGASWGHLGRVLGKMSKKCGVARTFGRGFESQNGSKNRKNSHYKCNLLFLAFFNIFFVIFHVFESQLVKTCIIFSFLFCIDFLLIFC